LVGPVVVPVLPNSGRPRSRSVHRGAAHHHAFEHVDNLIGGARIHHLPCRAIQARHRLAIPLRHVAAIAAPAIGAPDHLAVAVLHIIDHVAGIMLPPLLASAA
jgi:hypothetical protein